MSVATITRRGRREQNEDAVFATDGVIVLADGVGGQPGGRAAAQLAVGSAIAWLPARGPDELVRAVSAADLAVRSYRFEVDDISLASCTLTIVAIRNVPGLGNRAMVAHVGDSPAYLIRGNAMTQLTDVHTVAASLLALPVSECVGSRH